MEGIVVVGIVPIDRARWHEAALVGCGDIVQRPNYRFSHLRVIGMKPPLLSYDVLSAISDQEIIEEGVWIDAIGRHLETNAVDPPFAFGAQTFLHLLEKVVVGVP